MWFIPVALSILAMAQSAKGASQAKDAAQREGEAKKVAAEFEASQLEQRAGQTIAASQRSMQDVQRMGRLAESRALALAAASGGGASSPTVVNLIGNLAKEGAYRGAVELYKGEENARQLNLQAAARRFEGEAGLDLGYSRGRAYDTQGQASILSQAGGLFGKYGGGGPKDAGNQGSAAGGSAGAGDLNSGSYA